MIRFYLAAVDVVPSAVVLLPLFLVLYFTAYKTNFQKSMLYCLFCLYLSAVFSLVGIPNVTYVRPNVNCNLIPFLGMIEDLKNSLLNIALFIPLGFFLPVIWKQYRGITAVVPFGLGLSLMIELLQMLTYRATDVNDLITNTFGTVLGFLAAKPVTGKYAAIEEGRGEAYALCALSFCVMFFIHPFLSSWIWDWIL